MKLHQDSNKCSVEVLFTWRTLQAVVDVSHARGVEECPRGTGSGGVGAIVTVVASGAHVSIGFTHRGRFF